MGFMSPRLTSPMHPTQGGGGGGGGRGRGMGRGRGGGGVGRDRDLIGQTIKITQGPYKSHVGIVKASVRCFFVGGGGQRPLVPLLFRSPPIFSDYSFLVHRPDNWDDRHLLANAMASDFSAAWR
jgi:hypothetical protein